MKNGKTTKEKLSRTKVTDTKMIKTKDLVPSIYYNKSRGGIYYG